MGGSILSPRGGHVSGRGRFLGWGALPVGTSSFSFFTPWSLLLLLLSMA